MIEEVIREIENKIIEKENITSEIKNKDIDDKENNSDSNIVNYKESNNKIYNDTN